LNSLIFSIDEAVYGLSGALNKLLPLFIMFLFCMALFLKSISELLLILLVSDKFAGAGVKTRP
tara:strand:+ start:943 stop:1131 length:189 start_codon:yes stop_codon:yes gene_type:complete